MIRDWVLAAADRLRAAGVESPKLEAECLIAKAVGKDRSWVIVHGDSALTPLLQDAAVQLLNRRLSGEPLAYVIGQREFFGRLFQVRPGVLIPRQETEHLVEAALSLFQFSKGTRVMDIGTGSGCIAITLSLERSDWLVSACDVSMTALQIARENSQRLGASVDFHHLDGLADWSSEPFDLVISNPPYVERDFPLHDEVSMHEPAEALFGGEDGLDFYRSLSETWKSKVKQGGCMLLEVGVGQAHQVVNLIRGGRAKVHNDLAGIPRVVEVWNST